MAAATSARDSRSRRQTPPICAGSRRALSIPWRPVCTHRAAATRAAIAALVSTLTGADPLAASLTATRCSTGTCLQLDMHVDTIDQRSRNAVSIAGDCPARATAAAAALARIAAGTGIHRGDQLEPRRDIRRYARARPHDDHAALQRLAQRLEDVARELRQLVEKQHAVVRERELAGPQRAAADEGGDRGRVLRTSKRSCDCAARPLAGRRGEARDLERLALDRAAAAAPADTARASVLPAPGGPIMSIVWPPAAAISRARLAVNWPRTCAMSRRAPAGAGVRTSRASAAARHRARPRTPRADAAPV